jgi:hypothetical protein
MAAPMRRPALPPHEFSHHRVEERWIVEEARPRLLELRAEGGRSRLEAGEDTLRAESTSFFPRADAFGGARDKIFSAILDALPPGARFHARRVAIARTAILENGAPKSDETSFCTLRGAGGTLVLPLSLDAPDRLFEALDLLEGETVGPRADLHALPIAWMRGTASVLAHEAAGHPAEAGAPSLAWPDWLTIADDPSREGLASMEFDDAGRWTEPVDLSRGERPSALRRESYRDEPILRMTNLVVAAGPHAPALPDPRLEVLLLGGGRWDPVTDVVSIRVLRARRVDGGVPSPVAPFVWRAPRPLIPSLLSGGGGEIAAYPGVLCADEGQRIPVGSFAATLVTEALPR